MDAVVAILMGSDSDWPVLEKAAATLKRFAVPFEVEVTSAHRSPERTAVFVKEAPARGVRVFIAGAGGAAHLAGAVAANTTLPVIGVPVPSGSLQGLDALLATVQMPGGVPVATVAIGGAENAALLAVEMLALADERLAKALVEHRLELARKVEAASAALQKKIG